MAQNFDAIIIGTAAMGSDNTFHMSKRDWMSLQHLCNWSKLLNGECIAVVRVSSIEYAALPNTIK